MIARQAVATFALLTAFAGFGCTAQVGEDQSTANGNDDFRADIENGLPTINGLSTANGLNTANGLSTANGLVIANGMTAVNGVSVANGLPSVNGMAAVNGMTVANGVAAVNGISITNGVASVNGVTVNVNATLPVDCGATGVPGIDCWGFAQGILNPITGMLKNAGGVETARYLVRCALPATDSVNLVDYTGKVARMKGELGLAPGWKNGTCDTNCQEDISACLMALTNGEGDHIQIVLSSTKNALGGGKPSNYPYQEGAFYGNLFESPPKANFCIGTGSTNIATMWYAWDSSVNARMCSGWAMMGVSCPYVQVGQCTGMPWSPQKCSSTNGTMTSCKDKNGRTWQRPITTFMKTKPGT
jgi:hypothetical protein